MPKSDSKDILSGMVTRLQGSFLRLSVYNHSNQLLFIIYLLRHAGDYVENAEDLEALDAEVVVDFSDE